MHVMKEFSFRFLSSVYEQQRNRFEKCYITVKMANIMEAIQILIFNKLLLQLHKIVRMQTEFWSTEKSALSDGIINNNRLKDRQREGEINW